MRTFTLRCLCASSVALLLLALAPLAAASSFDVEAFMQTKRTIERELADGKTYAEIRPRDRSIVKVTLQRMARILEGKSSLDQLAPQQILDLYSDQEQVNTILTQAKEDSRMICKRERPKGSRIPIGVCKTVAQRRLETERAQYNVEHNRSRAMTIGGGRAGPSGGAGSEP